MSARTNFQLALHLLDRDQTDRGGAKLEETINAAEIEGDEVTLIGALCALGELCVANDYVDDAKEMLTRVVQLAQARTDDVCDQSQTIAEAILLRIEGR